MRSAEEEDENRKRQVSNLGSSCSKSNFCYGSQRMMWVGNFDHPIVGSGSSGIMDSFVSSVSSTLVFTELGYIQKLLEQRYLLGQNITALLKSALLKVNVI